MERQANIPNGGNPDNAGEVRYRNFESRVFCEGSTFIAENYFIFRDQNSASGRVSLRLIVDAGPQDNPWGPWLKSQSEAGAALVRILDEDDYRRRLDQAIEIPVGEEAGLLVKGFFTGVVLGPLQARNDILYEKQQQLVVARREMLKAIRAENERVREAAIIPIDVQEIVTGPSDELVKVP